MEGSLSREDVEGLLLAVTRFELEVPDLATRRVAILECIAALCGCAAGFWGWGRGHPLSSEITPLASLPFGFTPTEWSGIIEASLNEDCKTMCSGPIAERLRATPRVTLTRAMLWTDAEWHSCATFRRYLEPLGWDDWVTSVCYLHEDTWNCLTLWQRLGAPSFGAREASLLDLALAGIRWLQPRVSETMPAEAFVELTPRQRMVMMCLLDGLSRKQIAASLNVTIHTVNDHVKALYERFRVNSATALAAAFLKNR